VAVAERIPLRPWVCGRIKDNGYRCTWVLMELAVPGGRIVKRCDCGAWYLWDNGRVTMLTKAEVERIRG
jgi:hypothetical protein